MSIVLREERKLPDGKFYWGVATLNSEATLNSLSLEMIFELKKVLIHWALDKNCVGVFLQGAGEKAFCAGGDIKRLYQALKTRHEGAGTIDTYPEDFFENEYSLDYALHVFPKPVIVYGHGIVMGGGLGLMSGGSLKIATETTKIAMPEITIGLFPDVGGSFFLNKVPGHLGLYLGLTGTRLNSSDCLYAGLVDVQIKRENKDKIWEALLSQNYRGDKAGDLATIQKAVAPLCYREENPSPLESHRQQVDELLRDDNLKTFLEKMKALQNSDDAWIAGGAKALTSGCPTSAHVIWKQLHTGRGMPLKACFEMELNIAHNICKFDNFREGVRALLIDKDNRPAWNPARSDDVTKDFVEAHFASCGKKITEWEMT